MYPRDDTKQTLKGNLEDRTDARKREHLDRRKEVQHEGNELEEQASNNAEHCSNKLAQACANRSKDWAEQRQVVVDDHDELSEDIDDKLQQEMSGGAQCSRNTQDTYVKDSAEELSNNRHSDLDLSVHTAKDDRQIGTNEKLDVRNRNADATDNLVEDRCQHLRRAVILTDVLCRNVRYRNDR